MKALLLSGEKKIIFAATMSNTHTNKANSEIIILDLNCTFLSLNKRLSFYVFWWATRSERVEISETGGKKVRERVGGEMGESGADRERAFICFLFFRI